MAEYSRTELLNELARLLRPRTVPENDGGLLSPISAHAQVMEIAKTVFLLNPGAIFYLAFVARNSLNSILLQEIAVVEDMLVAVENLRIPPQSGQVIGNVGPSELANAATAALALEAAGTVENRPELSRFSRIIDRFTDSMRKNVTLFGGGGFRLPAGEARDIIRLNFQSLTELHDAVLLIVDNLRFLIERYNEQSIPTQVSQTALSNIRLTLLELRDTILQSSEADNDTNSRTYLVRSLASKVITELLAQFVVPSFGPVLTSNNVGSGATGIVGTPGSDAGSGPPFLAQAAGEGTPAEVFSLPGPWPLDSLDSGTLALSVDGVPISPVIDLSQIQGPGLHGKNSAPFTDAQLNPLPTWPGPPPFGTGSPPATDPPPPPLEDYLPAKDLHLMVDSNAYDLTSVDWGIVLARSIGTFRDVLTPVGVPPSSFETAELTTAVIDGATIASQLPATPRLGITDPPLNDAFVNDYYNTVQCQPPVKLGFKHLGTLVFFSLPSPEASASPKFAPGSGFGGWSVDGQNTLEDPEEFSKLEDRRQTHIFAPRIVMELAFLKAATLTHSSGLTYTAPAGTFETHYVGFYVRGANSFANERYEIVQVISDTEALIDTRDDAAGSAAGAMEFFGSRGDYTQFTFAPDLLADTNKVADTATGQGALESGDSGPRGPFNIKDTVKITVGPTVKTTRLPEKGGPTFQWTLADAIAAMADEPTSKAAGGVHSENKYAHASFHVAFKEQTGFNDKITIQGRSRLLPEELSITTSYFRARPDLQARGADGGFGEFPGPYPLRSTEGSAHEIFGFEGNQKVDPNLDPFLSVEELEALVGDAIDDSTTEVEIIETDLISGFIDLNPGTATMTDSDTDFGAAGVGLGYLIELIDGDNTGVYFILSSAGPTVSVQLLPGTSSRGFVGAESGVEYRLFVRQLRIASTNAGLGSSVEVTAQPNQLGFPPGPQYGTAPAIEAVNADGENLDMSGLQAGDSSGGLVVESVSSDGSLVNLVGGTSTGTLGLRFSFDSNTEQALATMLERLGTIVTSSQLLRKHNFDLNLNAIDAAISPLLAPGAALQSSVNTARTLLADLLAVLTQSPRRSAEYSAPIPSKQYDIESVISSYTAPRVRALDALLDSLEEHRFDRALQLLVTGDIGGFFQTTHETASFAGALMAATRDSAQDLPEFSQLTGRVEEEETTATAVIEETDADEDFSDTELEDADYV
jgi:hypothetical protein